MKVIRAEAMGMCFGVRDALKRTEEVTDPELVTIHGQLVHNELVLGHLKQRGFQLSAESEQRPIPTTPKVMVTAHGISRAEKDRLRLAGRLILDTTCPLVHRVHQAAQCFGAEGYHVLIIGQRGHIEVLGIIEDLTSFDVVGSPAEVKEYPFDRLGIVCQTTSTQRDVQEIRRLIEIRNPQAEVRFFDTVCQPTKDRQWALEQLLERADAIVVVGGRNSNNTKKLVARCERSRVPSFHVQDDSELRPEWFEGFETVGLTAGTSTLDETIDEVHRTLLEMKVDTKSNDCNSHRSKSELRKVNPSNGSRKIRTSSQWCNYFENNAASLLEIPWERGAEITEKETERIRSSLQAWQLGETSDGSHLMAVARKYASSSGDSRFLESIEHFIKEEQRHGADLGRFLDLAGIPRIKKNWGDTMFRAIRYSVLNIEVWMTPVIMVETHAMIYYQSIQNATKSTVLHRICEQILKDEVKHLRFQYERFAAIFRYRSPWIRKLTLLVHRTMYLGITLAVWCGHHRVLKAGGFGFSKFWQVAWKRMNFAWRRMDPVNYRWEFEAVENESFSKKEPVLTVSRN